MNPLIKPAYNLMNRLSYRKKFVLIASLFTIPLLVLSGRLALTYHTQADQALSTRTGMEHFREATALIRDLETLRDTALVQFIQKQRHFESFYTEARQSVRSHVLDLKQRPGLERHHAFLNTLLENIENNRIFPGNEAARIHVVFENANSLVEQAYLWRLKLSYEFVSKSSTEPNVIAILDIINNSYSYLFALGEARAFGSFYLQQQFIDSQGIELVDNTYQSLHRLAREIDIRNEEHQALFERYQELQMENTKRRLIQARDLLDESLIQAISPEGDPLAFYKKISESIAAFHNYNSRLLDRADLLLQEQLDSARRQMSVFYTTAATVILLLCYLFIGFFSYIRVTIRQLVMSAQRVARGEYAERIEISAQDELRYLAKAMDEMRLELKKREDELTEIGQTDGLTQLKNRKFFDESFPVFLSSSSRHNTPLCVVMMDIDHFKNINDTYGHQIGDYCLQKTAELFRNHFQRQSDVVARYGGEEFIAILFGSGEAEALNQTEALRKAIENYPFKVGELTLNVTASFGIAALEPGVPVKEKELISLADTMLYEAKHQGRNQVQSAVYSSLDEAHREGKRA